MESSMNNNAFTISKHETATFSRDQTLEESTWTMYFEDFFEAGSSNIVDAGDFTSSSAVSDAMSFAATTKKTVHVSEQEGFNKYDNKRTRNREIPFGRHYDLEDTASSPSRSPNVYSMMNLLDNNTRSGGSVVGEDTNDVEGGSAKQNKSGISIDLKKKGLCLVPMSMVTNFLD
ncbi:unnamed protein product [Cochlearia groenlandica]